MSQRAFPSELLKKPNLEKLEYFRAFTIAHPILKDVYTKLLQAVKEPAGTALIFIYGPSGIGKTTLMRRVEKQLKQELSAFLGQEPGRIPVVAIEAIAPDSGNFNWKDYYKRVLTAMEEPLIDYKINYGARKIFRNDQGKLHIDQRIVGADLRYAVENALRYRQPSALLIDEAQHLVKMASGRKLQDQLDSLKSLANISSTIHVLIGTYELLEFRNLSAQLSRRSLDIHFKRYFIDVEEDIQIFKNVIFILQQHLPLAKEPDLVTYWEYLYERSLGCVGILKDWLTRSLAFALDEKKSTLSLKDLESHAISLAQCKKMAIEMLEGESQLIEKDQDHHELLSMLGMKKQSSPLVQELSQEYKNKKNQVVGRRKAKRDSIGK